MAENNNKTDDAALVFDLLLGNLDQSQQAQARDRVSAGGDLHALHTDAANTLAALKLMPQAQGPDDLVEKTLARIRQERQLTALIARQESTRRRTSGPMFSLRELGAVAAAAVLLAVVFIPAVRSSRQTNYATQCASNVGQIGTAMLSYANSNKGMLPAADSNQNRWMPGESGKSTSNSAALFHLVQSSYVQPPVFVCPAVGGGSFAVQQGMLDFPAPKYVSYSYQHTVGPQGLSLDDPAFAGDKLAKMAILADSTPIFPDGQFHPDRINATTSDNHNHAGQNVLYMDGHVAWADKSTVGVNGDNIYLISGVTNYRGDESPTQATDTFLLPAYSGK
jgi:prepilin-type processing-associated H-X9-DG protein